MLGEVDCGFVIYVRAKRYNISIEEQVENSVNNLFEFVKNILIENSNYQNKDIIIAGSVLPTIRDNTNKKYLKGARREVNTSQLERTTVTIKYNNMLKNICKKNNYKYIDITDHIISNDGIVKENYLNSNPSDHHLDFNKTYDLWITQIKNILN